MSAFGSSWFGSSWFGSSWFGSSWMPGAGGNGVGAFAMDETKPLTLDDDSLHTGITHFPPGYWNADMLAQLAVIQFLGIKGWANEIETKVDSFDPAFIKTKIRNPKFVEAEIEELKGYLSGKERTRRRDEILQQDQNFQLYWLQLMMISRGSHPKTFFLLKIAARVGEVVMIYFKEKYHRPRPSQICPALMPLLEVPGHAAFPSGHSTNSHLTSLCLSELVPSAKKSLTVLADRVAHNREVAGVHYKSDSVAGKEMAEVIHQMLHRCDIFKETLKEAKKEWRAPPAGNGARPTTTDGSAVASSSEAEDRAHAAN